MNSESELPLFLRDAWTLDDSSLRQVIANDAIDKWNATSLCQAQVEWRVQQQNRLLRAEEVSFHTLGKVVSSDGVRDPASLLSLATAKIINLLEDSNNVPGDIITLAKCLNWTSITNILRDPRLPYRLLRLFLTFPPAGESPAALNTARAAVDIDELILANERFIRSRGPRRNRDSKYLVRFEQPETLFQNAREDPHGERLVITRNDLSRGGLELFDIRRPRRLYLQPNLNAFVRTFHRITRNILQGLNWQNVFIAGGIVLTTLLHVDPARDTEKEVQDGDIDLYLYDLNPVEANDKVREIYQVWSQNLPSNNRQKLVVKNATTITFLSDYPNRRIQIVLKLVPSPTAVLLNFDLDPCAMGFDGTEILMLPRAARCLETGYTTFTMDLVCGHHLHDPRATQHTPIRVLKYADRGFGIRILPSYVRALEDLRPHKTGKPEADHLQIKEPGLKTLKRVAYTGQDFVHRKVFGVTDLPIIADGSFDEAALREYVDQQKRKRALSDSRRAKGQNVVIPSIPFQYINSGYSSEELLEKPIRMGDFELWMRYHEAWRLYVAGEVRLDRSYASAYTYDPDSYDEIPSYKWCESFDAGDFSHAIDRYNDSLFRNLKQDICDIMGIPFQRTGWRNYLTRRIRRVVYGSDIGSVFDKQITLPLLIPHDLEAYLEHQAGDALSQAHPDFIVSQDRLLMPVHEIGHGTIILPDLHDQATAAGNLRYWVIGNELMWAGIHSTLDEVAEILWTLYYWTYASRLHNDGTVRPAPRLDRRSALIFIAKRFRDRNTLSHDGLASKGDGSSFKSYVAASLASTRPGSILEWEACLFRQWVLHRPKSVSVDSSGRSRCPLRLIVMDSVFQYPPPDELFWRDGEETSNSWM